VQLIQRKQLYLNCLTAVSYRGTEESPVPLTIQFYWINLKTDNMETEIWRDIEGWEGSHQISNFGRVKSLRRDILFSNGEIHKIKGKILKQRIKDGYYVINLAWNRTGFKTLRVHRLIGKAFIPNPYNKPEINHKNGIRNDNRLENIEWCTSSENKFHAFRVLGKKHKGMRGAKNPKSKAIIQFSKDNIFIREYDTITEAAIQVGRNCTSICFALKDDWRTSGGYKWKLKKVI
jgi:hypothetical protein